MSSRLTSKAADDETTTSTPRSSTTATAARKPVTKPVTKPTAPRLSSTTTRPATTTASTASRTTASTTPSSLSKPPARPTVSTAARKPATSTTTSPVTHRTRPSVTSVEASGDEEKKDGISARPKRMSIASTATTGTERSTVARSTISATPARRVSAIGTTPSATSRTGVKSPTTTRTSVGTTTTRPTSSLASRTRPGVASTPARPSGALADRKRLSTIPASPAVKPASGGSDGSAAAKKSLPAAFGERQSTRSVVIEQRIREFDLVNQMLQSAMKADGMDENEQETVGHEAKATMDKLRSDLAKIRAFEKEHGRLPNEEELDRQDPGAEDVADVDGHQLDDQTTRAGTNIILLQAEVADKQAQIDNLESRIEEISSQLEISEASAKGKAAAEEEHPQISQDDHVAQIEKLESEHKTRIEFLENTTKSDLDALTAKHQSEIEALKESNERVTSEQNAEINSLTTELEVAKGVNERGLADKDAELQAVEDEIKQLKAAHKTNLSDKEAELQKLRREIELATQNNTMALSDKDAEVAEIRAELEALKTKPTPEPSEQPSRQAQELLETQQKLEAAQERHAQAKENAKSKIAKAADEHAKQVSDMEEQHKAKITELELQLETARNDASSTKDELSTLRNSHTEVSKELESLHDSSAANSAMHQQDIKKLEEQIADLERLQTTRATASGEALEKLKQEHAEQLLKTKDEHDAAQAALENATNDRIVQENQSLTTLQEQLSAARENLTQVQTLHAAETKSLEGQLRAFRTELDEHRADTDSKASEHAAQVKSIQEELSAKTDALTAMQTTHASELDNLKSESQKTHDEAIAALKSRHTDQLQQLQEQSKAALESLEDIDATNSAKIEQARSEGESAKEKALQEQADSHAAVVKELEAQIASHADQLVQTAQVHQESISRLRSDHTADKEAALAALSGEHSAKIRELTNAEGTNQTVVQELKNSHADELRQLESRHKASADDIEAAKVQVQTLKSALAETELQNRQKDEEHKQELEKAKSDVSQAIAKLSEQSARVVELQSQHTKALQQAKSAASQERSGALEAMKKDHEEELSKIRTDLETAYHNSVQAIHSEHNRVFEELEQKLQSRELDFVKVKDEHRQTLTELQATSEKGALEAMDQLKAEHAKALESLQSKLDAENDSVMQTIAKEHASELAAAAEKHSLEINKAGKEHEAALAGVTAELETLRAGTKDTTEVDSLKAKVAESQKTLQRAQEAQAEMMSSMSQEHESEIAKLSAEIAAIRKDAQAPTDTTEIDALRVQLEDAHAKHRALAKEHDQALTAKDTEFKSLVETHRAELDALRHSQTQVREPTSTAAPLEKADVSEDVARMKSELLDARNTIAELSQQYADAAMDAETHRIAAIKADQLTKKRERELSELKGSLAKVEYASDSRLSSSQKKIKVNGSDKKLERKGTGGLTASKWASDESPSKPAPAAKLEVPNRPETTKQPSYDGEGWGDEDNETNNSNTKGDQGAGSTSHAPSTTGAGDESIQSGSATPGSPDSKRNVAGQMAGIMESIQQLSEISEQQLEANERMAKTLSRHSDNDMKRSGAAVGAGKRSEDDEENDEEDDNA